MNHVIKPKLKQVIQFIAVNIIRAVFKTDLRSHKTGLEHSFIALFNSLSGLK